MCECAVCVCYGVVRCVLCMSVLWGGGMCECGWCVCEVWCEVCVLWGGGVCVSVRYGVMSV